MAIPELSLRVPQFQFAQYTPIQYTQENPNIGILVNAAEKAEARKNAAYQTMDGVDKALSAIESQLNPEEINWFNDYKRNIRSQIYQQIDAGNYGSAINLGIKLGGQTAQDTEILNRIKTNTDYQNFVKSVKDDKTIDNLTKEMVLDKNKYNYDNTGSWVQKTPYVEDKPISVLQTMAFQMTAEEISGYDNTFNGELMYDDKGNVIENPMKNASSVIGGNHTVKKDSQQRRKKEYEAMVKTWNYMLADPLISAQLKQNYDKLYWAYEDRLNKSEDLNISEKERERYYYEAQMYEAQLKNKDGFIITDPMQWAKTKVVPGLITMAYDNITTGTVRDNNYSLGSRGNGPGNLDKYTEVIEAQVGTTTTKAQVETKR